MCKFDCVDAPGYVTVSTALKEWVEAAPAVIEVRWHVEEREARDRLRDMILEQTRHYVRTFGSIAVPCPDFPQIDREGADPSGRSQAHSTISPSLLREAPRVRSPPELSQRLVFDAVEESD